MSLRFKIWITVCLLFVMVGQLAASTVVITGTISKPSSQTVAIKYTSNKPNQDQAFVTANLDQQNNFYTQFDLHEFVEAYLYVGKDYVCKFYIEPGEEMSINVDQHDIKNTLSFNGSNAAKNNFWVRFNEVYPEFSEKVYYYRPFNFYTSKDVERAYRSSKDIESYSTKIKNDWDNQKRFLETFNAHTPISSSGYARILSNFEARWVNNRVIYYYLQQTLMRPNANMPESLVQFFQNFDKQSTEQLENKEYINAMLTYLGYVNFVNQKSGPRETSADYYQLITSNFIGISRNYLMTRLFLKDLANKRMKLWEDKRHEYDEFNFTDEWRLMIDAAYFKLLEMYSGIQSVDFSLPNSLDAQVNLTDYRGSVVYISFWATWCKPCLDNFSRYKAKKDDLENQGVTFINISIDKDKGKALDFISRFNIEGINLFAHNDISSITQQYMISSLPAYFVIDKYGNLTQYSGTIETVEQDLLTLVR